MRTNLIIDDNLKDKWWEIKREAAKLDMTIGEYFIFCHDLRKKTENKEKLLKLLDSPLSNGKSQIDAVEATKKMWKT
ncbi:MAG: hypothetical protein BAJALOKI2v1_90064 [Promethearchaeota archaeon]|nr:MAG: hypothetical protein BAJALOKI2v1_90064 [Candidatus Lokiarchaeota archaeon]